MCRVREPPVSGNQVLAGDQNYLKGLANCRLGGRADINPASHGGRGAGTPFSRITWIMYWPLHLVMLASRDICVPCNCVTSERYTYTQDETHQIEVDEIGYHPTGCNLIRSSHIISGRNIRRKRLTTHTIVD